MRNALLAVLLVVGVMGCGKSPTVPDSPELVVIPQSLHMIIGEEALFTVTGGDGTFVVEVLSWDGPTVFSLPEFGQFIQTKPAGRFIFISTPEMRQYSPLVLRVRSGSGDQFFYRYQDVIVYLR